MSDAPPGSSGHDSCASHAGAASGTTVAGLLLAAGASTRLGQPKALAELAGERLVDRALRVLRDGGCDPLLVVVGAVDVGPLAVPAQMVRNRAWAGGMASSLRAGLTALNARAPAVVVSLVDTPLITATAVVRLIAAWHAGAIAAVASYHGQGRHPVLLDAAVWAEVAASARGDIGARTWLRAHPSRVTLVTCDDAGDPHDVDTMDDLTLIKGRAATCPEEDLACS